MPEAFLFTGQGSQFPGMGKDLAESHSAAAETFAAADEALGESLSALCFEGPEDRLGLTENTQPATLTVSIAAWRAAGARRPDVAAGHSLGEYSALTAAGVFGFADAVRLVRERARRMQAAVPAGVGGMVALRRSSVEEARELAASIQSGVCDVANYNTPAQIVLSGSAEAMDEVVEKVGARMAVRLAVSVPFHSSLLKDAAAGFAEVLRDVPMRDPSFPVWCNVDARPVTTAAEARDALERQFAGSVLWTQTVEALLQDIGVRHFVEFGPKPTLARMVQQIAQPLGVGELVVGSVCTSADLSGSSEA